MSSEELAKLAQNPVGNLVSIPPQNNTNFNTDPLGGTQSDFIIEPVCPINVNGHAALSSGATSATKNGTTYCLRGNTWFQPHYGANGVYYTVVPPPLREGALRGPVSTTRSDPSSTCLRE